MKLIIDQPHPTSPGGVQKVYRFDNGYEASVIQTPFSYGGDEGLWELAVKLDGQCCYDTPITDDVEGWLSWEDVEALLARIEELPPAKPEK
jgi:hypothetical protein